MLAAVTMLGSMHVAAAAEETMLPAEEPEQLVERQDAEQQETEAEKDALLGLTTQCMTYSGSNKNAQNYSRWSTPIQSALAAAPSGELMRVQAGAVDGKYLVEYYDSAYDYKRNLQTKPVVTQINSYAEGETSPSTPQLVKVNDDTFFLLWTKGDKLYYCRINGSGQAVSGIYEKEGALSDCVPIVKDGKCIWYVWEQGDVTFYEIPVGDPAALKVSEINNGHEYTITYADADSNVASRTCKVCGYSESFTTPDSFKVYGAKNGANLYSSRVSGTYAIGDTLTFWVRVDGTPDNSEITIESSNPSVAKITGEDAAFLSCGTAEVKIYPTYRPSLVSTYTLNVPHSYGEGVITRSGNCAEEQITSYTCTLCGDVKTEKGSKDPSVHTGGTQVKNAKAATCGAEGYSGEHFYTASSGEKNYLVKVGWNYEGIGWNAPVRSNTPVYRLYNPVAGDHHYTTSAGERDFLVRVGWQEEGIGWYGVK